MKKKKEVEETVHEGGFTPGNIVKVVCKDNFRGHRLAVVLDKQKWCVDQGIPVMLVDAREPIRYICVWPDRGDEIAKVSK
jgi:uncharacterized protein YbaR (Trm112 family)